MEELLNIFDHFKKRLGFLQYYKNGITGREVVVDGYGPGGPPGGVALAELSGRELKD